MNPLYHVTRLSLTHPTLSCRQIAASTGSSKSHVSRIRRRLQAKGHTWEDLKGLRHSELRARLLPVRRRRRQKPVPDFATLVREFADPTVTRRQVWNEYRQAHPADALSYSQFCHQLAAYAPDPDIEMRQLHRPGRRVFVDFSGKRPSYKDPMTRKQVPVELFVGVLPCSNLTFAVCVPSQSAVDFIDAHKSMFDYFGGVPQIVVPDNLKAAVIHPGSDLVLQRHYSAFAAHYGLAVLPARPGHPRDKGKVEGAVLIVQRHILARLRKCTFSSLAELNDAVRGLLDELNARSFQKLPGSRRSRFEDLERTALRPLPKEPYECATWTRTLKVPKSYHVRALTHHYSVPHTLVGEKVEVCLRSDQIEIAHDGQLVATHDRNPAKGGYTTKPEHQPESHRAMAAEQSPEKLLQWAAKIGKSTHKLMATFFRQKIRLQGLPAAHGMRGLERKHGAAKLERAAARAVKEKTPTVAAVRKLILEHDRAGGRPKQRAASRASARSLTAFRK